MKANGAGISVTVDPMTLNALDVLARRWGVSREVAMERAVAQAAPQPQTADSAAKIEALQKLQSNLGLTSEKVSAWQTAVHDARR